MKTTAVCVWKFATHEFEGDYYETACGQSMCFADGGGVNENGFQFCPFCGKEIEPIKEGNWQE